MRHHHHGGFGGGGFGGGWGGGFGHHHHHHFGLGGVGTGMLVGGLVGGALLAGAVSRPYGYRRYYCPPPVPVFVVESVRPAAPYPIARPYANGRVRGLFIGINYTYTPGSQLQGCVNDVRTTLDMLARIQFPMQEACILVDDPTFPGNNGQPTRANIISHMQWLVHDARPGDCFTLMYSGRGVQVPDQTGREPDGRCEAIVPADFSTAGYIVDDLLYEVLVRYLPAGVRLTVIMDCGHSGTVLDLPYTFVANDYALQNPNNWMMHAGFVREGLNQPAAEVIMFAGCADNQNSAQTVNNMGMAGGAFTNALAQVMTSTGGLTYVQILQEVRRLLQMKGLYQVPQLSSSKPIDLTKRFSMFGAFDVGQFHPFQGPGYGSPQPQPQGYSPASPYTPQGQYPPPQGQYPPGQYPPAQGYPPSPQGYAPPPQYPQQQGYGSPASPGQYPPQQQGYPASPGQYPPQQGYPASPAQYPPQGGYKAA